MFAVILARLMIERKKLWFLLIAVATIPRLIGAFVLPNTFGDAYVYIRDIGALSTKIKAGTFAITDLYGFWLPLYQFVSALANVFVGNGFYTGKIVSALAGVGVCLLVYAITLRVVQHHRAALLSFLLIALNPLHIMNSASAMTDVPHALLVLASLYFVLKKQWVLAAVFAALAGLTRVESWMLIGLIPAIQFWKERRVSIPAILIMLFAPAFWFYVSWKAAGDWLACFKVRDQYKDWLLAQNPALAHFSAFGVLKDGALLVSGIDPAVLLATFIAAWLIMRRVRRRTALNITEEIAGKEKSQAESSPRDIALPLLIYFFPFLALLVVAYATHQQPIIFPRYGLILFSLGIPVLAWTYFEFVRSRTQWSRRLLVASVVLCALNFTAQCAGGIGELKRYAAQRRVADYLRAHFDVNAGAKIFCDEGTVRALSGIPTDRFVTSADFPVNQAESVRFLLDQNVRFLVYVKQPGSKLVKLYPDAESVEPEDFDLVIHSYSNFLLADIWVFERPALNQPPPQHIQGSL